MLSALVLFFSALEVALVFWLGLVLHKTFAELRFWIDLDMATLDFFEENAVGSLYGDYLKFRGEKLKELSIKTGVRL